MQASSKEKMLEALNEALKDVEKSEKKIGDARFEIDSYAFDAGYWTEKLPEECLDIQKNLDVAFFELGQTIQSYLDILKSY